MKPSKLATLGLALALGWPLALSGMPQGNPQARARLRENINALMLVRMTQALDLTEEQAVRIYPPLTKIDKEKAQLQNRLTVEVRDLREALGTSDAPEARLLELVAKIRDTRRAIREKEAAFDAVLEGSLTPVQKARYVIFQVDFFRGLGERVARAREVRGKIERRP
jgi:Spy/CpxP family protein refolding chaperone